MLKTISTWLSFVKFSHTIFALPFALAAMVVASRKMDPPGWPGWRIFLLIVAAMVCARTCAMAFNRIVDRKFDAKNPRTSSRHLPTGQISIPSAVALCVLSGAGLIAAAGGLNRTCLLLSPVALFLVCFYSLTKRFTDFTHVWLGVALALAPMGAWLAVQGGLEFNWTLDADNFLPPVLLSLAVVFWLIGFDIIYALQDYEFDRQARLGSLVVRWGPGNALMAAFLSHMVMWGLLAAFGAVHRFRIAYFAGMAIILGCLVMEHWLARRRSLGWINAAFFRLNGLISLVYLVATIAEVSFEFFRFQIQR
jgi:4-hydroxybenzoate polyprenyltransferase